MVYIGAFSSSFKSNLLKVLFRLHKKNSKIKTLNNCVCFLGKRETKRGKETTTTQNKNDFCDI